VGTNHHLPLERKNKMESKNQKPQKPPLSPARVAGEVLAGIVGGLAAAAAAAVAAFLAFVLWEEGEPSEWGEFAFFFGILPPVVLITYSLGSAIGVYLVGKRGNQTGSFWATLAGSFLGLPLAPVAGTIGFNLTRTYKPLPGEAKKPPPAKAQKPPLNVTRIAVQFLAGTAAAFGVFLVMVRFVFPFLGGDFATIIIIQILYYMAPPLCSAICSYLFGKIGNQRGSFAATFIGSLLGEVVGIFSFWMCGPWLARHLGDWSAYIQAPVLVSVGAVVGFNLTRRYKSPLAS
jgi:MFS family permease